MRYLRSRWLVIVALLWTGTAAAQSAAGSWRYDRAKMAAEAEVMAALMAEQFAPMAQQMAAHLPQLERDLAEQRKRAGKDPAAVARVEQLERAVAQSRAMAQDPKAYYRETMMRSFADERAGIELAPDGRAILTDPSLPDSMRDTEGRWSQQGRTVTLTFADPDAASGKPAAAGKTKGAGRSEEPVSAMSGPLEGDSLTLRWTKLPVQVERDPGLAAILARQQIHLVRR
ncbi:MAG: hypothetical protein NZ555_14845 [Geminicoccaceae bacterium]|nr:hypothetical protein [Geminicoccaceae bacterium]MCX8102034.1 hypothetical protein [Geminicoccaceae bacterium]MDW8371268.1 hypothetical protein [Geminicoccaceae bacterium]